MEPQSNLSFLEKFQEWIANSISIKLLIIGFIVLILLIPQAMTLDLIQERQLRQQEAEEEISAKWSQDQTLTGPYLAVPYLVSKEVESAGEKRIVREQQTAYFLPDHLEISGNIQPQALHRGIFDVVVYSGEISLQAEFPSLPLNKLNLLPEQILWDQTSLMVGLTDLRGIGENPSLRVEGKTLNYEPFLDEKTHLKGLQVALPLKPENTPFSFDSRILLKGSKSFEVIPLGKTTRLSLNGDWPSPSFQGQFLPEKRMVSENFFESEWQVLHFNRPFGQEFIGGIPDLSGSAFGLDLMLPADQYQQSIRTAKYSVLIIILSFLSLFLMEIFTKSRIHPLQYILIGFALVLYYTLLIAFSEQIGFKLAYLIASMAIVLLLALYSRSLFPKWKNTGIFTGILTVFYIFIFVIVRQQDFALLIGSLGLFVALAITMFISRKIDWYKN
ncbi:cell envelope integrity protein CreD [Algoriphagus confluentis]|uniref:Cell envelope integrity protein CreD n=1 Tax=Algoriphagus confluentis TaxID=1697556 RepID=A0ABQ6PSG1_9BACT|nr:cell envelope integrity protein CreD [Algoriphagus confluentis]